VETTSAPLALVVDDDPDSRTILAKVAEKQGFRVVEGKDGVEAVRFARELRPDLILMDIGMPRKSGLDALREIREADPHVPVVIVSAAEHPESGEMALDLGAVNFVLKPFDLREIRFVVDRIRGAIREVEDLRPALSMLKERRTVLELGCDLTLLSPVVAYLGREIHVHFPGFDVPVTEVKLALYEAIANAIEHGNLEIDYDAKTKAMSEEGGVRALIESRRADPRYGHRRVRIDAEYEAARVTYRIRDEGPGFSPVQEEERHHLGDVTALHGRGIHLMRHYMDEVSWNPSGNEIRLVLSLKRRPPIPPPA
jgi:DNA-binding response OmpR family regulator